MNMELFSAEILSPGEVLRQKLEEKGWTQDELAAITGKSRKAINDVICNRAGITPEMAVSLAAAFGTAPSDWMQIESSYRISRVKADPKDVERRANVFTIAPIREMQRRGWIKDTNDIDELEAELTRFFDSQTIGQTPVFNISFRGGSVSKGLSGAEKAWAFRAKQLAAVLHVRKFDPTKFDELESRLRTLAAYPKEIRHISKIFAEFGIRFVVVEHLAGSKVDGAAFWLDEHSPVIAISGRIDRIDNIWFTIMHEVAHIKNGDALSVDSELLDEDDQKAPILVEDEAERRANEQAAYLLIPTPELESFIRRVGPLYSQERIIQFAHRMKIHPGIIVGQLQKRKEIGWNANRKLLVKVRSVVTETSLTDGWGRAITPGII